jgi:hypothetical protein
VRPALPRGCRGGGKSTHSVFERSMFLGLDPWMCEGKRVKEDWSFRF